MRVYTFIPVQEAFQVDYIADRKVLNGCVYIGVLVAQIRLNGEGIGSAVLGNGEVQVVTVGTGTVPVVKESNVIACIVLTCCFYGHTLEGYELVLVVD